MSTVSGQAGRYGELLGAACGVQVRLAWSGRPAVGVWGGWVVQWRDGPTEEQMRAAATDILPPKQGCSPASVAAPAAELSYSRRLSAEGAASALLIWLECHPDALRAVGAVHLVAARDEVPYPERADDRTRHRAQALLGRSPSGMLGYEVLSELAGHGRCGWAEVAAWLDGWRHDQASAVVDLATERMRRRHR